MPLETASLYLRWLRTVVVVPHLHLLLPGNALSAQIGAMSYYYVQETQLSLTNRATHMCKCNGVTDFLKTAPSPYVLPCHIWLFCVKGCGYKYGRTSKIGEALEFRCLVRSLEMGGVADPRYTPLPTCVIILTLGRWVKRYTPSMTSY